VEKHVEKHREKHMGKRVGKRVVRTVGHFGLTSRTKSAHLATLAIYTLRVPSHTMPPHTKANHMYNHMYNTM
jgi:hypothetical protein